MADISWIKLTTNMFDNEKIDFIESLPEADSILIIWIKLLTFAGKCNMSGYIMLTENIPYTDEMLAHKFRRPLNTVKLALETFRKLEMITQSENGMYITNWEKHQNEEKMSAIREYNRLKKQEERAKKKTLAICQGHVNDSQDNVKTQIIDKRNKKEDIKKEDQVINTSGACQGHVNDNLIENYTTNEDLKTAIYNFITHRKDMKKPIKTANTLNLILQELNKYVNDSEKIAVINQSIMNGWQGLFELKKSNAKGQESQSNIFTQIGREKGLW